VGVELDPEAREGLSALGRAAIEEACRCMRNLRAELAGRSSLETD
jgi:hypothetical protein